MASVSLVKAITAVENMLERYDKNVRDWPLKKLAIIPEIEETIQNHSKKLITLYHFLVYFEKILKQKEKVHPTEVLAIADAIDTFINNLLLKNSLEHYQVKTANEIKKLKGLNWDIINGTTSAELVGVGAFVTAQALLYMLFNTLVFKRSASELWKEFGLMCSGLAATAVGGYSLWRKRQSGEISDAAILQKAFITFIQDPLLLEAIHISHGNMQSLTVVFQENCRGTTTAIAAALMKEPATSRRRSMEQSPLDGPPPPHAPSKIPNEFRPKLRPIPAPSDPPTFSM